MANKHRKYMEDDFDLDLYRKEQSDKTFFNKIREKSKKLSNIIKIILVIISFITAYTLYNYTNYLIEVWRSNRINQTARSIIEQTIASESHKAYAVQNTETIPESKAPVTPTPALLPAILNQRDMFQNDDIVAYLKIEGSNIDFPVVHTDNNLYYLTHDLSKQKNAAGSAFMDYENQVDFLGYNTVIYAHNMRDGSMFHNLRNYEDEEYFASHKIISLQTLYEDTLWEIYSFYETSIEFLYNTTTFRNAYEFLSFAEVTKEKSKYPSDVIFTEGIQILTLSTCTNRDADSRYVVHAVRLE